MILFKFFDTQDQSIRLKYPPELPCLRTAADAVKPSAMEIESVFALLTPLRTWSGAGERVISHRI